MDWTELFHSETISANALGDSKECVLSKKQEILSSAAVKYLNPLHAFVEMVEGEVGDCYD